MQYLEIRNWDSFQHYKDRDPPWIKLYPRLLSDYSFCQLSDASKAHLIAIWMLASRYKGLIPYDANWITKQISATEPVDFDALIKLQWFEIKGEIASQNASGALASCKQSVSLETETETETETEPPIVPLAVVAYNALAEECGLSRCQRLTKSRKTSLKARLRECGGMEGWEAALARIRGSPFLRGQNDRGWKANFDFLVREANFTKLMEGGYENGTGTNTSFAEHAARAAAAKLEAGSDEPFH